MGVTVVLQSICRLDPIHIKARFPEPLKETKLCCIPLRALPFLRRTNVDRNLDLAKEAQFLQRFFFFTATSISHEMFLRGDRTL